MTSVQVFHEIWMKRGRVESLRRTAPGIENGFGDLATMLLLGGRAISDFDLRLCRMLYDAVYPVEDPSDQHLQLFLVMMTASLNRGNLYVPRDAAELTGVYRSLLAQVLAAADADDPAAARLHQLNRFVPSGAGDAIAQDALSAGCFAGAREFSSRAERGAYCAIIGSRMKPIVRSGQGWYFERYHAAEVRLGALLLDRFSETIPADDDRLRVVLRNVFAGTSLDLLQKAAVALTCLDRTTVITGGPGTGKTTVVAQALLAHALMNPELLPAEDILITAPTGRAAARLQESIARAVHGPTPASAGAAQLAALRGRTVHGILGYDPRTGGFRRNGAQRIDARIVVVDEVSMLDISIFRSLLEALDRETTLILLGDRNQLPSVEAGAVLGDLTASFQATGARGDPEAPVPTLTAPLHERLSALLGCGAPGDLDPALVCRDANRLADRCIVLTRSFRSNRSIAEFAHLVNTQDRPSDAARHRYRHTAACLLYDNGAAPSDAGPGVFRIDSGDPRQVQRAWVVEHFGTGYAAAVGALTVALEQRLAGRGESEHPVILRGAGRDPALGRLFAEVFRFLDGAMTLCVVRKGEAGSEAANFAARTALLPELDAGSSDELFHGCAGMTTRNQPHLGLWNGDRGIILRLGGRHYFAVSRAGAWEFFSREEVAGLESSWALTVHKSQGSEFDRVLLILPSSGDHPLMSREIIYTALTRAKSRVVIFGAGDVFDAAVGRQIQRRSGLESILRFPYSD